MEVALMWEREREEVREQFRRFETGRKTLSLFGFPHIPVRREAAPGRQRMARAISKELGRRRRAQVLGFPL